MAWFTLDDIETAAALVHQVVPPTPQYNWPLLAKRADADIWVKHENHTPTGAFKIRGGLTYIDALRKREPEIAGVTSATRGNHGQSIALAATRAGLRSVIYIPHGNSREKNAAMAAFGAELVTHGRDFDEAKDMCSRVAEQEGLHFVPSFHPDLVKGVSTYALELFRAVPDLDLVYAPIGLGSGICGLIEVRDLLGLRTEIVGVVADNAPAVAHSFEAGRAVGSNSAQTFADGMAVREPHSGALEMICRGVSRVETIGEDQIAEAMRIYYTDTHNVAEGAGAAPLAALLKDATRARGKKVAVILSGGNVDREMFLQVLQGQTPRV